MILISHFANGPPVFRRLLQILSSFLVRHPLQSCQQPWHKSIFPRHRHSTLFFFLLFSSLKKKNRDFLPGYGSELLFHFSRKLCYLPFVTWALLMLLVLYWTLQTVTSFPGDWWGEEWWSSGLSAQGKTIISREDTRWLCGIVFFMFALWNHRGHTL